MGPRSPARRARAIATALVERLRGLADPRSGSDRSVLARWGARLCAVAAGAVVVLAFNARVVTTVPPGVVLFTIGPTVVLVGATALVTDWHRRAARARTDLRRRIATIGPWAAVLAAVLAFNAVVRPQVNGLTAAFGLNLTDAIHDVEGSFVVQLQDATPEPLMLYFSAVYVVGYGLLLFFPPLAYAVLDDGRTAAALLLSYALNYLVGSLCYLLVVAHGPRNFVYGRVEQPLFSTFPEVMHLTGAVNSNSNVFPSLHAAMSVTVLAFAVLTRESYPRWLAVAGVLAPSVLLATMVLGIHWLVDVVAGAGLALATVVVSRWLVARFLERDRRPRRVPTPVRL